MALGALDIIIAADTAQLRKGMDTAVGIMQSSTKTMENVAKTAAGAIAGYFTFSAIKDSITHTLDLADSLGKLNQKVGISVDLLYSMQAQAKLSDVEFQTLEKSLLKFNKGLGTASMGSGDTTNALKNLNIELKDSSGHLKTSDQYLFEVADRFKGMPDGIAKSTLAMQLFGKSGADMIPLLNGGSESLKEFTGIMDNETAKSAERLNDSFTRMELSFEGNKNKILTGMLPAIESLSGSFENFAVWMSTHEDDIKSFTDQAGNDLTALGMVGHDAFSLISDTSTDMLKVVNSVFSAIPNMIGESSNDSINNFGFFEYFILGLSTATNGLRQFIANGKMAYATAAEYQAKYMPTGHVVGTVYKWATGGDQFAAAEARYDYAVAKREAEQATNNVSDTYNTLLGLKKQFVAKSTETKPSPFVPGLEDYAKNEATKAKTAKDVEARLKKEHDGRLKKIEEEAKIQRGYLEGYADLQAKAALDDYNTKLGYEESYRDIQAQNAIEQYNQDQANLEAWADLEAKAAIKKFEDETKFWDDLFVNINKAMDDQFFNAMSGKFTSFGDWLKDFWGSITQSMTRGLSKSLADTIMGTGNNSEGGIANWFKSFGGFSGVMGGSVTPAALIGATTNGGLTTTVGGTVLNSAGQIVTSGSDSASVLDALNTASTANSMYSAFTGGISGTLTSGSASLSGMAYNMGWTTGGDFFAGGASGAYGGGTSVSGGAFGTGQSMGAFANGAAQVGAAYMAAYYTGRGIDKLTGSDTYSGDVYGQLKDFGKMSTTDKAILATLSMIPGGSILAGGLIGKRKTSSIGSGIEFNSTGSADNVDARSYIDMKSTKKSWFKSSTSYWTEYQALSDKYTEAIASTFRSYDYLLTQMGESAKVSISAGKYAGTSFQDAITKSFISVFTSNSMSEYNTSQLYTIWSDYASSINKTMMEAFSSSISGYIDTTRSFTEWKLGSGSVDQLKFTADYLAKDFNALSHSMGVSGLTVENYLQKYDEAIKTSFSPETISTWKNLGNALMSATDANTKYTDSLKSVQSAILPQDMMLSKSLDATQIYQTITTQNDTLKYSFAEMISILRNILYNQQFNGLNVGIPA